MGEIADSLINKIGGKLRIGSVANRIFTVGDCVIAFDNVAWSKTSDLPQGNDKFYKAAKIIKLRTDKQGGSLADVMFTNGKKSNGHFLSALKHCL